MTRFADKYIKWTLWLLFCGTTATPSVAQMLQDSGEERYELAQDLYEEGRLNQVIDTLRPFFDSASSRQSDILSLSAATYAFLDQTPLAKQQLLKLFNLNPFYQLDQSIPELRYLQDELVIYPKYIFQFQGGVYIYNRPWFIDKKQADNIQVLSEKYALDPGDPIGTFAELTVAKALWPEGLYLYSGIGLSRYSFRYTGKYGNVTNPAGDPDQVTFSFREKHWWFHAPVYLKKHFLLPDKSFREQIFIPYAYGGFSLDFMSRRTASWSDIRLVYESAANEPPNTYSDIDIRRLRKAFNYSLLFGGGIEARSGYHVGFLEVGLAQNFRNLQRGENTDLAQQIEDTFYYQGSDFSLTNIHITVGYSRYFFGASER